MKVHDFTSKLADSNGTQVRGLVTAALRRNFGDDFLQMHRAGLDNDFHGADFIAEFRQGHTRLIEVKVRQADWLPRGQEADLALESWGDIDRQTVGWTRDRSKLTDYIVFVWTESGRSLLLDARLLRAWFAENWEDLRLKYGFEIIPSQRGTRTWRSEAIYVPHQVVVPQLAYRQGYVQKPPRSRQRDCQNRGDVGTRR